MSVGGANPEVYEEVINILNTYVDKVNETCDQMGLAAEDCVDNTEDDPAAVRSAENLQECLGKIRGGLDQIQTIISGLQRQLDDAIAQSQRGS